VTAQNPVFEDPVVAILRSATPTAAPTNTPLSEAGASAKDYTLIFVAGGAGLGVFLLLGGIYWCCNSTNELASVMEEYNNIQIVTEDVTHDTGDGKMQLYDPESGMSLGVDDGFEEAKGQDDEEVYPAHEVVSSVIYKPVTLEANNPGPVHPAPSAPQLETIVAALPAPSDSAGETIVVALPGSVLVSNVGTPTLSEAVPVRSDYFGAAYAAQEQEEEENWEAWQNRHGTQPTQE
jgi:hypothetical protein